jgi:tRNA A37 N6-isopentenylltransferase MiaA
VTGRLASEFFAQHTFTSVEMASLVLVICRPRDELYRRIDQRARDMIDRGLIAETEGLLRQYGRVPTLETLGYKQACDYLEGSLPEGDLVRDIAMQPRRFATRQMTYWRKEPKKRGWCVRPGDSEEASLVAGFEEHPARAQKRMELFRAYSWSCSQLVERVRARLLEPLDSTEVWCVWVSA